MVRQHCCYMHISAITGWTVSLVSHSQSPAHLAIMPVALLRRDQLKSYPS